MRTVFVANSWRSFRSAPTSTKALLTAAGIGVIFFLRFLASYREPRILLDYTGAWQSDPSFVRYLRRVLLQPPSGSGYNLDDPSQEDFSENGQSKVLGKIFQNQLGKSFIEIDAGNGEKDSISLYLERELGWSGILVVENFENFEELLDKNRQSYALHARVSDTEMVSVLYDRHEPVISNLDPLEAYWEIPLFSIMATMKSPDLDVLILSADGIEMQRPTRTTNLTTEKGGTSMERSLPDAKTDNITRQSKPGFSSSQILDTIPWEMVTINVICVDFKPEDKENLTKLLTSHDYSVLMEHVNTLYFVRNDFQKAE